MSAPVSCPKCGAIEGIYARIDARGNQERGAWVVCPDIDQPLDCSNCDHEFELADGWPHPARQCVQP